MIRPIPAFQLSALASAAVLAVSAPGALQAQPAEPSPVPVIVVTGQAVSTDRALRDQAAADNVISVVRSDGIGRLPDRNVAEALQRLTGVSVERDQGEGRYVRIRGLGPDLNAVTINGSLVPAADSDRRAVALDVLPSSLIRSLVVSKTLLPEMDANSLGGTIDVQTVSAFDHKGRFISLELGAGYADINSETSPSAAVVWSDLFAGGTLGIAAGFSIDERRFGSDNTETGGAWDGDALEGFERRDYNIIRRRSGLALNVEWKPSQGQLVYLRTMASNFSDNEQRLAHITEFDSAQAEGALGDAESVRELKDRKDEQTVRSIVLGTEQQFGDWRLTAALGASEASEETPRQFVATKLPLRSVQTSFSQWTAQGSAMKLSVSDIQSSHKLSSLSLGSLSTHTSTTVVPGENPRVTSGSTHADSWLHQMAPRVSVCPQLGETSSHVH